MQSLLLTSFLAYLQVGLADPKLSCQAPIGNGFKSKLIPCENWTSALNNPNATGRYPIDGYDVSKPYPTAGPLQPISGWSIDVNITADVPFQDDKFITGANIRVSPPAELITTDSNGTTSLKADVAEWKVCISWFELSDEALQKAKNDDGSCTEIFSNECMKELTDVEHNLQQSTGRCRGPEVSGACEGLLAGGVTNTIQLNIPNFDKENQVVMSSDTPHERGNDTDYGIIGRPSMVLLTWGYNQTAGERNSTDGRKYATPRTSLVCPRANKAVDGSRVPSAGGRVRPWVGWMLVVGGWVVFCSGL